MKTLTKVLGLLTIMFGLFVVVSSTSASTTNSIQPASSLVVQDELQVLGTTRTYSIRIGAQGYGGVTFFNGTIINETTDVDTGAEMPVTFGDDVRVDGSLWRGETAGVGLDDNRELTVNDDMIVSGNLTVAGLLGTGIVSSGNILDGTIANADLANNAVTSNKIVDGTIATADLANDVVTSAKIVDGTITGDDISSSADLSVATGTFAGAVSTGALTSTSANFTGNVTQSLTSNGLVKAILYADSLGNCAVANQYTYVSGTVSCSGAGGTGGVTFTLPFNVFRRAVIATPSGTHENTIIPVYTTYEAHKDRITVFLYDETGADVNGEITLVVF